MGCIEMKQKITEFGTWAENNYMVLVYAAGALVLPLLFLLALSLLYGYWSNGLWGTHFAAFFVGIITAIRLLEQ